MNTDDLLGLTCSRRNMCKFCNGFDFSTAMAEVDEFGARILLSEEANRYPKERQFNFCPACGRYLKGG